MEGESPLQEEEEDEDEVTPVMREDGESPMDSALFDKGSGDFEGSADDSMFIEDQAPMTAESETGSGESWTGSFWGKCLDLHVFSSFLGRVVVVSMLHEA